MKQPNKVRLVVLIPPEMKKAIEGIKKETGQSEGEITRYALALFLENRKDEKMK